MKIHLYIGTTVFREDETHPLNFGAPCFSTWEHGPHGTLAMYWARVPDTMDYVLVSVAPLYDDPALNRVGELTPGNSGELAAKLATSKGEPNNDR